MQRGGMNTTWFAVDRDGCVAAFWSGWWGAVPEEIADLGTDDEEAAAAIDALPECADARRDVARHPALREDDDGSSPKMQPWAVARASRGLYVYAALVDARVTIPEPYARVLVPTMAITVDVLPAHVRARLEAQHRLDVSFEDARYLQPAEHGRCQVFAGGALYLARDGFTVRPLQGREAEYRGEALKLHEDAEVTARYVAPLAFDPPIHLPARRLVRTPAALEALFESLAAPRHAGGPMPDVDDHAALIVAVWAAERGACFAKDDEKAQLARLLEALRFEVEHPTDAAQFESGRPERWRERLGDMSDGSRAKPRDSIALEIARAAASIAASRLFPQASKFARTGEHPRAAATVAERVVKMRRENGSDARVAELDDRLMLYEFQRAAAGTDAPRVIERVLWRDVRGDERTWIVRVAARSYGILRGATWSAGPRDDVLASVPDALFAEATRIVLARDA